MPERIMAFPSIVPGQAGGMPEAVDKANGYLDSCFFELKANAASNAAIATREA